ncbi:MAG: flavodoxin family protein [Deltaproteobacteria bacterium HGW-Deltaproteobacteria-13]|jgi:multimeric flavodoxin WrbA|nr:MAG: flavodoxin family protein [Deltaproteobacteria bacterium HGW-Deltaproteobacteria-13]
MKIVGFVGSPRKKGNTTAIVNEVLRGAKDAGAEIKIFNLNELSIRGCQACYKCQTPEGQCVQKDDMATLYDELFSADAIVVGSPVFMFQVTGQMKIFADRLFALLYPKDGKPGNFGNKIKGKKAVAVYSQGQPDTSLFAPQFDLHEGVLGFVGFKVQKRIVAGGMTTPDAARENRSILEKAYAAGADLTK